MTLKVLKKILYILELSNKKYYIGKTINLEKRLKFHKKNKNNFVKNNFPIKSYKILKDECDIFDEDNQTKLFMKKYGINNVRGGSYTREHLTLSQINLIKTELATAYDLCFTCLKPNHYSNYCPNQRHYIPFGKYCGKRIDELPKEYINWLLKNFKKKSLNKYLIFWSELDNYLKNLEKNYFEKNNFEKNNLKNYFEKNNFEKNNLKNYFEKNNFEKNNLKNNFEKRKSICNKLFNYFKK